MLKLTLKETDVARRLAQWETIASIAKVMGLGEGGVRYYIRKLKIKYGNEFMELDDLRIIIKREGVRDVKN